MTKYEKLVLGILEKHGYGNSKSSPKGKSNSKGSIPVRLFESEKSNTLPKNRDFGISIFPLRNTIHTKLSGLISHDCQLNTPIPKSLGSKNTVSSEKRLLKKLVPIFFFSSLPEEGALHLFFNVGKFNPNSQTLKYAVERAIVDFIDCIRNSSNEKFLQFIKSYSGDLYRLIETERKSLEVTERLIEEHEKTLSRLEKICRKDKSLIPSILEGYTFIEVESTDEDDEIDIIAKTTPVTVAGVLLGRFRVRMNLYKGRLDSIEILPLYWGEDNRWFHPHITQGGLPCFGKMIDICRLKVCKNRVNRLYKERKAIQRELLDRLERKPPKKETESVIAEYVEKGNIGEALSLIRECLNNYNAASSYVNLFCMNEEEGRCFVCGGDHDLADCNVAAYCEYCHQFIHENDYEFHLRSEHDVITCDLCGEEVCGGDFVDHLLEEHKYYLCDVCGKCISPYEIEEHKKLHAPTLEES